MNDAGTFEAEGAGNTGLKEAGRTTSSGGSHGRLARNRERQSNRSVGAAGFIVDAGDNPELAAAKAQVARLDSDREHAKGNRLLVLTAICF